uniref:polyphenol oxidase I, chloroplastic-like n=1 Tax=Erigeron canadensis TaxID=72917 RepID=UPI001CB8A51B|nr:polyphenol oxidase I, chloroplastic-like [Erigeron canadensis]
MSTSLPLITSSVTTTFTARTKKTQGFRVSSCNNVTPTNNDDNDNNQLILPETQKLVLPNNMNVDRRNLLVGLGGVCTAANLASLSSTLASPITAPDPKCKYSYVDKPGSAIRTLKCCPPNLGKEVKPFVFPHKKEPVRMRWPAHKGTKEQVEKYKRAIAAMRALPDDHPHSFKQQASIHCAYCNGGYTQIESGFPDVELQIHNSWLFFPFHRWYLYFYERILGKLIDDPTFALPYWNWDDPAGMEIPEIFLGDESNPLYDFFRDPKHLPPRVVDLAYSGKDQDIDPSLDQKECNLITMHRDMITNAVDDISFFGGVYVGGSEPVKNGDPSIGSVEAGCHTAMHLWVGRPRSEFPNGEDMGNFYSAGYDPLFFVHHANVDRMWKLWKDLCLPGHVEPVEDEWLNSSYLFYDENEDLIRVYNKDAVDMRKLGFDYSHTDINNVPWRNSRPAKRKEKLPPASGGVHPGKQPLKLTDKNLKVRVTRPDPPKDDDRKNYKEVLFIDGIKHKGNKLVKFDVFVNDKISADDQALSTCDPEYAGGFAQIAHGSDMAMPCGARFGLDELLEDTNSEDDKVAVVKLVPRTPAEKITIGNIRIDWVSASIPLADVEKLNSEVFLPVKLGNILKVSIDRPDVIEKRFYKEVLSIKGKNLDNKAVKFDVFVNDKVNKNSKKEDLPTPCSPEYAGRFARLPLNNGDSSSDFEVTFDLDKLLRDTKTNHKREVVVALVPKTAETKSLIITDILIKLV